MNRLAQLQWQRDMQDHSPLVDALLDWTETASGSLLNPTWALIVLGLDWLGIYRADPNARRMSRLMFRSLPVSDPSARSQLATFSEAVEAPDRFRWERLVHQQAEILKTQHADLSREGLRSWLDLKCLEEWLPYAAVTGQAFCTEKYPLYYYLGVWFSNAHEVTMTLNQAGDAVHKYVQAHPFNPAKPEPVLHSDIKVGQLTNLPGPSDGYRLRRPLRWIFDPHAQLLSVEGFSPMYKGEGSHAEAAQEDFYQKVNSYFQALYRTRPFNRTEQQDRHWHLLCRLIDVQNYSDKQPLVIFRSGQIVEAPSPDERVVVWEGGDDRRESITPIRQKAPDAFAAFPIGQYFEAEAVYRSGTGELLELRNCVPIEEVQVEPRKVKEFWQRLRDRRDVASSPPDNE